MRNAIEMRELTKTYGKSRGIKGISLTVEEGDIFGYLGPNGAGKSTSIRCLLGMLHADSGEAYVLGYQVGRQQREILKRVGYVPAESFLYPSMRAGDVIRYAARMRGMDCSGEAERLCCKLEVDRRKRIGELSLGNRKKISIVCALQHMPELIILDEPTSGLDPLMQEVFFDLLTERSREGVTCFLSSHVLQEVKRCCRHVGILKEGRLVKADKVENLIGASLRKVRLSGVQNVPSVAGMGEIVREGEYIAFPFRGEMAELLQALQGLDIKDMLISEPSLEEVFMHFYVNEKQEGQGYGSGMAGV